MRDAERKAPPNQDLRLTFFQRSHPEASTRDSFVIKICRDEPAIPITIIFIGNNFISLIQQMVLMDTSFRKFQFGILQLLEENFARSLMITWRWCLSTYLDRYKVHACTRLCWLAENCSVTILLLAIAHFTGAQPYALSYVSSAKIICIALNSCAWNRHPFFSYTCAY